VKTLLYHYYVFVVSKVVLVKVWLVRFLSLGVVVGHVFVKARFKGRGVVEFEKILVDTGASFTIMPLNVAERYFIETPFTVDLKLGDGRVVKAKVFVAEGEIEGRRGPLRIMAFENAIPVVGVDTLETLGLKVDPVTGRIEKTEYYMLYI
jgi:predicted aspartyl protease